MTLLTIRDLKKKYPNPSGNQAEKALREWEDAESPSPVGGWQAYLGHGNPDPSFLYLAGEHLRNLGVSFRLEPRRIHTSRDTSADRRAVYEAMIEVFSRCRSYLFIALSAKDGSPFLSWQCGYFEGLRRQAGVLPVLKKDTGSSLFAGRGLLSLYPYGACAKAVDDERETLWMLRGPKEYVNFDYWVGRGFL
jgi:hypothetical protein